MNLEVFSFHVSHLDHVVPKIMGAGQGLHSTMDIVLALHPAAPGLIPSVPKIFLEKF